MRLTLENSGYPYQKYPTTPLPLGNHFKIFIFARNYDTHSVIRFQSFVPVPRQTGQAQPGNFYELRIL